MGLLDSILGAASGKMEGSGGANALVGTAAADVAGHGAVDVGVARLG